jgi:low affinity Fe/Cu permease
MDQDIVEKIMRHSGYLTDSYVRLTDEEVRRHFHEHEDVLYITRPDRRHTDHKLAQMEDEIRKMQEKLALVKIVETESK